MSFDISNIAVGYTYFATGFTTTGAGDLASISVAIGVDNSDLSNTMGLYTDSAGQPGTLLESWSGAPPSGSPPPVTTLTSALHPLLSSGTQYWFVITQNTDFAVLWYVYNQAAIGEIWVGNSLGAPGRTFPMTPPAIQLDSSDVPEPASAVPLGFGCSALLAIRRRLAKRTLARGN
jgi:hypothetical protein